VLVDEEDIRNDDLNNRFANRTTEPRDDITPQQIAERVCFALPHNRGKLHGRAEQIQRPPSVLDSPHLTDPELIATTDAD